MAVPNESSEDVNDFLQRIRELGERRDKEDDERTKKLEEEILQGRKERQARRAERARSLALTDDSSTLNIARLSAASISPGAINPPEHLEPTPHTESETPSGVDLSEDTEPSTERRGSVQETGMDPQPRELPTLSRSRAGTLSWQQRPPSREFGSMSPGSASPTRSPTRASHLRHHSTASDDRPRSQYGFPRLSKDFSGLSQSPERGSSAYRAREERSDSHTEEVPQEVPEVSEESSAKIDKLEAVEERPLSPPRAPSRDGNLANRFSVSSVSAGLGSPVHLSEAQKLEPRQADASLEEPAQSPSQRRMSPERSRSTSPTKGMGGFVQSAMMRRSDSVSKRWSAQLPQGLSRSNSIISNRSSVAGPSLTEMGPPSLPRPRGDSSALPPRPDSSHSDAPTETTERPTTPSAPFMADKEPRAEGSPSRLSRPTHSRSASSATADGNEAQSSPFVSKTMDPRRWSPSKSTWLESALNRPELPRQPTRPPSQPNWARDRQSRGSVDMGRVNSFKEVTPVGLMRTPPPGLLKKTGVSGPSLPASPDKEAPESPLGFPLKKTSISGASMSGSPDGKFKDGVLASPLGSPLKRPSFSGPSFPGSPEGKAIETVPESPAEFPFRKSSASGASISRSSVAGSPSEFPFRRPGSSGISVAGSPKTNAMETTPVSPFGSSFKKSRGSSASFAGSPDNTPKKVAPESPLDLGDSNKEEPKEEAPTSPSPIEETLKALSGGLPAEEPKNDPQEEAEVEQTEEESSPAPAPAATEVTPEPEVAPALRDPPKSLVSPKPNFSISTSSRGQIPPKPKAPQSPVVDFRANLKKREVVKDSADTKEPEFKNVFGRLKKTETRNYVAPDELKGNILRGKASLNNTGGPKKTERVDEFRKSLVSRKDEMKAGGGSIRRNTASEKDAPKPAEIIPEAIARRQNMNRTNSLKQSPADEPVSPSKSVGSRASVDRKPFSPTSSFKDIGSSRTSQEQEPLSPFPADEGPKEPGWPLNDASAPAPSLSQDQEQSSSSPAVELYDEQPEVAHATSDYQEPAETSPESLEQTREFAKPVELNTEKAQSSPVSTTRPLRELPQAPVAEATASPVQAAKNKLAGRINPALAGLLSRGPPAPEGPKKEVPAVSTSNPIPGAPLEHATKGRARGPKRRPPQAVTPSVQDHTKEVGAISYSEATPSQTPSFPVESLEDDSDHLSQYEDSVPDTDIPRPESPVADHLPIEEPVQLPHEPTVEQPEQSFTEDYPAENLPNEQSPVESDSEQLLNEKPSDILQVEEDVATQAPVDQSPEALVDQFLNEQPPVDNLPAKEPITEQLPLEKSPESPIEQPINNQHSENSPPVQEPVSEQLPVEQTFVDQPSISQLDFKDFHADEPISEQTSVESSPELLPEQPLHKQLSLEDLDVADPLSEQVYVEETSVDQPSTAQSASVGSSSPEFLPEQPLHKQLSFENLNVAEPVFEQVPVEQTFFDQSSIAQSASVGSSSPEILPEQPLHKQLSFESLNVAEPVFGQVPVEQTFVDQPAPVKPSSPEFLPEQSLDKRMSFEDLNVAEPVSEQSPVEQSHIESPSEQPVNEKPSQDLNVEEDVAAQLPVDLSPEALVEQFLDDQPPVNELHDEQPFTERSPVEQPAVDALPVEDPGEHLPTKTYSPEVPQVERFSAESLHAEVPIEEELPVEQLSIVQPSIEQPTETNTPPPVPVKSDAPGSRFPQPLQTRSLTTDFNTFPSRQSEASHEPVSPGGSSPSSGPPVPSKSSAPSSLSPSTPKSRWAQQNRYASPSPSPLRSSYNENRMDAPVAPRSVPGAIADSSREALTRPVSHPSPPVPPKDDDATLQKPVDPRRLSRKMSAPSLVAQASEAREVIAGFFKTFPNPQNRMDIDPQVVLMNKPDDSKIRTVKRHIWELTGDGRRQELPSHQEYILYQGSMYICVHVFEVGRSTTTEVYLWRGDDVSDTAVDNEQSFARKVARENSSKVQIIRQGKEPTRFIQALGGIMITRRGSSSRHNSSALYMLCGRKHLGQMTFDEVDYSLRNLCSGFPYVVSAPFGKLYLWKGKGSGPEETGAARLIGMDLGLTGEFEEVGEGEEPEDFFDVFAGPREAAPHMCQDYWKLKPKYNHFRTRLLRVDHELGQPTRFWNLRRPGSGSPVVKPNDCVQEIEPFCYRDLTEKDIYVLDTFFEIYVIIGEQATQKSADFASAVVFAHEYGILATSLQDRPFIPKSYVALGGVADRCQSAFRKWNPRNHHAPFVFPLDVVIESLRSLDEE